MKICDYCGCNSDSVKTVNDPYFLEVEKIEIPISVCIDCLIEKEEEVLFFQDPNV